MTRFEVCGSHWSVYQLVAPKRSVVSVDSWVWNSNHMALYITPYWEKAVTTSHSPICSQWLNYTGFWWLQSHSSWTEKTASSFSALTRPDCKAISPKYQSNTYKNYSKNMLCFPAAVSEVPQQGGSSCCLSLAASGSFLRALEHLPEALSFFISNSLTAIWWHSPLWITVYVFFATIRL